MNDMQRDCEHGQLARSCEICELKRELAAANVRVEELKADRDKLLVMASRMADCINRCQDEDDCSDLSAAYDFRQEYPR